MTITVKYIAKHRINYAPHYVFTKCGLCYNCRSGRLIKQVLKGSTIGYVILGKFKSLNTLRSHLEKITTIKNIPF
jgi:hypothetical protein